MTLPAKRENTFEKIRRSFMEEKGVAGLTPDLQVTRDRVKAAWMLLSSDFNTEKDVVDHLKARFQISRATAYRDLSMAKNIFGDLVKANKDIERHLASEMAKELFRSAKDNYDATKKTTYFFIMIEQQKIHMKVNRLDKFDIEMPDMMDLPRQEQVIQLSPEFLNNPKYAKLIDPKVLQSMKKSLKGKTFKNFANNLAEDVAFIEIDDGTELELVIKKIRKLEEAGVAMSDIMSVLKNEFDA